MTRAEWDRECRASIMRLLNAGVDSASAIRVANARCTAMYGARPDKPQQAPGLPLWAKLTALGMGVTGMNPLIPRIFNAVVYTVTAIVAALQVGHPATVEQWIGLVVLGITTFWGKFSSSTTLIAPNRKGQPVPPPVIPAPELFK